MYTRVVKKRQVTKAGGVRMYVVQAYTPDEPPSINSEVLAALYLHGPQQFESLVQYVKQGRRAYNLEATRDQVRQVLSYLKKLDIIFVDETHSTKIRCWHLNLPSPFVDLTHLSRAV